MQLVVVISIILPTFLLTRQCAQIIQDATKLGVTATVIAQLQLCIHSIVVHVSNSISFMVK